MPVSVLNRIHFNQSDETPTAPQAPFTVGTEVGVPTGTVLTDRTSLGSATSTETISLVHPVTGLTMTRPGSPTWRGIRFTGTIQPNPASGVTYWFDQCEFTNTADFYCVDLIDGNGTSDVMVPLGVFTDCTFDGNDTCSTALNGGFLWAVRCHVTNAENGYAGLYYTVLQDCNLVATTDGQADPHSDGVQCAGIGASDIYHCWTDSGADPASATAAVRIGTEFSAVADVGIYYTGFGGTQHGLQVRGDAGAGDISGLVVRGCRWAPTFVQGHVDFQQATIAEWTDNAFFDGTVINNPVP